MKKLFPIALIAFIAVLGTSCKKEVQESPDKKVNKLKSALSDPKDQVKHTLGCLRNTDGHAGCKGECVPPR